MQKIKIESITKPRKKPLLTKHRKYQIFLDTNKVHYFTNYKASLQFIAETNRFLNLSMHKVNKYYAETFKNYRHLWFYLFDRQKAVNLIQVEKDISQSLRFIDDQLFKLVHNTIGPNGNTFSFHFLKLAVNEIRLINKQLVDIAVNRNEIVLKYEILILIENLDILFNQIEDYGLNDD